MKRHLKPAHLDERSVRAMEYLKTIPKLHQGAYERSITGKLSPRSVIKAKCYECNNYEDVVNRTVNCSVFTCPLWAYRPIPKGRTYETKN